MQQDTVGSQSWPGSTLSWSTCVALTTKAYSDRQKNLTLLNDMLFINDTMKGSTDMVLLFVVPACKCQAVLDLCHQDIGHQGRDRTYSLLQERFWWPKMRTQMMMTLQNCEKCKVYKKKDPKVPLCSIATTELMDLTHVELRQSPWCRRY